MSFINSFKNDIFSITDKNFEKAALSVFQYQYEQNKVYNQYVSHLGINPDTVTSILEIPFLPIDFFKQHKVVSGDVKEQIVFESSGTTGQTPSRHYVEDLQFYQRLSENIFEQFYGKLNDYVLLALLPSYLEREHSSLVYMISYFIEKTGSELSGFYLDDFEKLIENITAAKTTSKKVLLFGATFGLLDFVEQYKSDLSGCTIVETGGMKGRRREMTREELHDRLRKYANVSDVGSEYGMTELLSQAYTDQEGVFKTPAWMKIILRDLNDPFQLGVNRGGINVIDLANVHSCAFIETSDIGQLTPDGFKVLGRMDNSDLRGCSLLTV